MAGYNSSKGLILLLDTVNTPPVNYKFPLKYIRHETYKVSPNQNQDLNSTVDTTGNLHRYPLDHTRSKIEFNTPILEGGDVSTIMSTLASYWNKASERKVSIQYFNPLKNDYESGTFYIPDIDFTMYDVDESTGIIRYMETRIAFIEY